ncbi:MAG TPA: hypothetical protein ENK52_04610 [Saprospiraceae bacterium]|nr:hypothetical protein [Saprospiraceae bacterium]
MESIDWYDSQKNKLGRKFAKELQEIMKQVKNNPTRFPKIHQEIRKAVLKKFPYLIIFEVQNHTIFVLSIF